MYLVNTFDKHRSEPEKSLDAYIKEQRLSLGHSIAERHKVYLDTKFWLLLGDHHLKGSHDPAIAELADVLAEGVKSQSLVCPISDYIFLEVLKQTDPKTLDSSLALIDTLSEGISVLAQEERRRMELLYLVLRYNAGENICHEAEIFVWTKLAYALGFTTPNEMPLSPQEELVVQKAFFDQTWEATLADMVKTMGTKAILEMPRLPDLSGKLNEGKFAHAHEAKSLQDVFSAEVVGMLDTLKAEFQEMFEYLSEQATGRRFSGRLSGQELTANNLADFIYSEFRRNPFLTELPSLGIPAALHAAIRWDKERKYKANDWHDIGHATAALPYFDTFLTEHSLRHLLTRQDLGLDQRYGCTVVSDPKIAVEVIRRTISQPAAPQDGESAHAPSPPMS